MERRGGERRGGSQLWSQLNRAPQGDRSGGGEEEEGWTETWNEEARPR